MKEYRKEFVKLFDIKKKDFGYLQKMDEKMHTFLEKSIVRIEEQKKIVLICHDESTFRMSETPSHRWVWNKEYGFFNKGSFLVSILIYSTNFSLRTWAQSNGIRFFSFR